MGRNDRCSCGSGKKVKHCCGESKVLQFPGNPTVENFHEVMSHFIPFAMGESLYDETKEQLIKGMDELEFVVKGNQRFYQAIFEENQNRESLLDSFVMDLKKAGFPPHVCSEVRKWKNGIPGLFKIADRKSSDSVELEEFTSRKSYLLRELEYEEERGAQEDQVLQYGILLPWGQQYHFAFIPFPIPAGLVSEFSGVYHMVNGEVFKESFYQEKFVDVMQTFHTLISGMVSERDVVLTDEEKSVVALLREKGSQSFQKEEQLEDLEDFWSEFCSITYPNIKKPEVFAAALEYFYFKSGFFKLDYFLHFSKKEVASRYGVSVSAMSNRLAELEKTMMQILSENEMGQQTNQVPDESNDDFDFSFEDQNLMELVYEAAQETSMIKKIAIIEKILTINPDHIDGLLLASEVEDVKRERHLLLLKAVLQGRKELIELNKQDLPPYLWMVIEARPAMRALAALGYFYQEEGRWKEAADQFEDLIDMNPEDNQGIRYDLLEVYQAMGDSKKINELKKKFPEFS